MPGPAATCNAKPPAPMIGPDGMMRRQEREMEKSEPTRQAGDEVETARIPAARIPAVLDS